ncbi:probable GPI-anchored adhesin-like protein PGA55 isoform X2 [Tetranychus urticae]|nr:probable GPI-anchored adhesin-like protein PGA55 isoform X2 [Tetranychus urticae]XP_015788499.1 probable GPI-anchored adhesin-like protein PGA55 isoform X2 [Tetranychus urticae]XP_015788500.1 probable GPI-anchored adhesin-like protein PGA55 isoform X2 [Tetranychus urticae]XP_015788501.1 probable GPI-anchored adhesin-like protein PGA55 isoform X2 [Tetranychus urticae]
MKVKWTRNLDGNSIIDPNEPLSNYKGADLIEKSTIPMRSKSREKSARESTGCNLIFGPTRKSSSHRSTSTSSTISSSSSNSTPAPSSQQQNQIESSAPPTSESDRTTMTKLSNFLGIFKLTPSSASSTNGSIKSTKSAQQPTSIKVVRRGNNKNENDGLFRTDSRRRRRANNLLQRNSDIRRSWNAAMTGRSDPVIRRPASPTYRPTNTVTYRSISPSIASNQQTSPGVNGSSSRPSSLDGSGHFGNSCKVNSMPAPIVTLPECCLEGSDSEVGLDSKLSTSPENLETQHVNGFCNDCEQSTVTNDCDEVDKISVEKVNKIIRPAGPPPPPPTTTSVSLDGSVQSSDDVFIQVQITASSKSSNGRLSNKHHQQQHLHHQHQQQQLQQQLQQKQQKHQQQNGLQNSIDVITDEADRPLSPIFESCTEKVTYEESVSPTGSLIDSRTDSRSSNEDVNTILRPPSSTAGSSSSQEMALSEDGGLGESVSYDASSGCSWETSSILTGSVCLSPGSATSEGNSATEILSPSSLSSSPLPISSSTPHHHHKNNNVSSPIMISDPVYNNSNRSGDINGDDYLYEPRMSEVIRVTVKKAEIPEVVTLRSEDIIDLDSSGSTEENSPSSPSSFSSSISSIQRIRKGSKTGILKDSNCLNNNGVHNCRSSTPKKVHFAESAKVRTTKSLSTSPGSSPIPDDSSSSYDRSSPLPPSSLSPLNYSNGTTITTSSTVTIKKPTSSSSRRLFQSSLNQTSLDDPDVKSAVPNKAHYQPPGADDYSSEQITQFNPESFCLSNQSLASSTSSSPSLASNKQPRVIGGITNSKVGGEGEKVEPVAGENDDPNESKTKWRQVNQAEGRNINSKSQMISKSSSHNIATINCTSSVAHVLNQNINDKTISISAKTSTTTVSSTNHDNGNINSGFPYLSRELDAHRKLSALHQRKLSIAREESARSSLIIQGLGVVVQRLTQQLDSMNGPTLRSQLSQVQNNFDQLDAQFRSQEEALRSLQVNYHKAESELREEVKKLTCELADEERRHEREKIDLVNSFELELDAAKKQFNEELDKVEEVKNELKALADQLKGELRNKVDELSKANNRMNQMEKSMRMERDGRTRRAEERITYLCKEIQSLKDVLELKEIDLKRLRAQVERDEGLSRDLVRAQSTIEVLKQRLEQLEIARNSQADAMNRLKAENEALIDEIVRDQREMDKIALRKEELEYTLYNMVTIGDDEGYINLKTSASSPYEYVDNVSFTEVNHAPTMVTNGHDQQNREMKNPRNDLRRRPINSAILVSSNGLPATSSSSSSTTVRVEKIITSDHYKSRNVQSPDGHVTANNEVIQKYSPDMINDSGFEDISVFMKTNA